MAVDIGVGVVDLVGLKSLLELQGSRLSLGIKILCIILF